MTNTSGTSGMISIRKPVAVFLICFFIAASLWFSIRMSEYYHAGIKVRLGFRNLPAGRVMIEPDDSLVSINLRAQGYKLLSLSLFHKAPKLLIDVSQLDLQWKRGESHGFYPLVKLAPEVMKKLNLTDEFESFSPDTLFFTFRNMAFKKVPVLSRIQFEYEKNYRPVGTPVIKPDSVIVSAMSSDLDEISFVATEVIRFKGIHESHVETVELIQPEFKHVQLSHGVVNVEINVTDQQSQNVNAKKTSKNKRGRRK